MKKRLSKFSNYCLDLLMNIPVPICFIFVLFKSQNSNKIDKSEDGVLGIRTRATGWKVQTYPLSWGGCNPTLIYVIDCTFVYIPFE